MSRLNPVFNVIKLLPTPSNPVLGWKANLPPLPEIVDRERRALCSETDPRQLIHERLPPVPHEMRRKDTDMRKIHGYWSKMWRPQTNSMSSIRYTLVLHVGFIQWPSNPSCPVLQGHSMLEGGVMSGDAPSHTSAVPDSTSTPPLGQNSTPRALLFSDSSDR